MNLAALPPWAPSVIAGFVVLNVVIGIVTYITLLERKFAARMQSRIGPYRVGPHGLLQPIADALKLMMKEDVVPTAADRRIYNLAPIVFLIPCMLIFATIPFAPGLGVADLNIGILFFLAVSSMEIVGLFMAGWGSNNKYALLSAMRAVNQIISYDLPFIFSALIPVLLTGSLKLGDIAAAQQGSLLKWFVFYPVIGQLSFIMFIVATLAAENRVPFDILEAESELVAGFRVEYSGMKFALIQLGEYAHIIGSSFLGALLFLGAWSGPGPEWLGPVWFLLKMVFMFLVVTWIRWSFVRIRVDQILALSWKVLMPATLVLLISTAIVVVWRTSAGF
jgi:NADH-quinone oxidoreductase subunit H